MASYSGTDWQRTRQWVGVFFSGSTVLQATLRCRLMNNISGSAWDCKCTKTAPTMQMLYYDQPALLGRPQGGAKHILRGAGATSAPPLDRPLTWTGDCTSEWTRDRMLTIQDRTWSTSVQTLEAAHSHKNRTWREYQGSVTKPMNDTRLKLQNPDSPALELVNV